MRFSYALTLADYKAALRLHARGTRSRWMTELFLYRILPVIGILAIVIEIYVQFLRGPFEWQHALRLMIVPAFFVFLPLNRINLVRKQFKQIFPGNSENFWMDINESRVICDKPGISDSTFTWNAITSFDQDDKVTMLYISKERFLFFPTSAMSPDQRSELAGLANRNRVSL